MKMKESILVTFSICILLCSADLYAAEGNRIVHGHLYEYNYPSQQSKDTLGKATIYTPDAKSDLDRDVPPGLLPQYMNPNYYGYKEVKHIRSAGSESSNNYSTPHFGERVSKRRATKNSFQIRHSDGIYHYRDGIFYLQKEDTYVIHEPHVGFRVPTIPVGRREYTFDGTAYYYYYGTFYVFNPVVKMYDVAVPPVGAIVDWIPRDAEMKEMSGETYYIVNGVKYKEVSLSVANSKWYQVVAVDTK
jgi:hypothetical protein